MKPEAKTYTLEELVGPQQRWRHWSPTGSGVGDTNYCGQVIRAEIDGDAVPTGVKPYPPTDGYRDCPDCLRIHMRGGR